MILWGPLSKSLHVYRCNTQLPTRPLTSKILNLFLLQYLPEFTVNAGFSNMKQLCDTVSSAGFEHVSGTAEVKMTSGFGITLDQGL